jgi:hypothetical protein
LHQRKFRRALVRETAVAEMVNEAIIEGCAEELLRQEADKETYLNGCKRRKLEVMTVRLRKKRMRPMDSLGNEETLQEVAPLDWETFLSPPPPPKLSEDEEEDN